MTFTEIYTIAGATVATLGGSALIIGYVSKTISAFLVDKAIEKDKAKYGKELETLKDEYKIKSDLLSTANATYFESKKLFAIKRIEAIERVWLMLDVFDDKTPSILIWLDLLALSEYSTLKGEKFEPFHSEVELKYIRTLLDSCKDLKRQRIYLNDKTYISIQSYITFTARLCVYIKSIIDGSTLKDWRDDKIISDNLSESLGAEIFKKFKQEKWKIKEVKDLLMSEVLSDLKELAAGSDLAKEAMNASHLHKSEIEELMTSNVS